MALVVRRCGWVGVNALPFVMLVVLSRVGLGGFRLPPMAPVFIVSLLLGGVAVGQAVVLANASAIHGRWLGWTAAGLGAALLAACANLAIADAGGAESAGIAVGHAVGGCGLAWMQGYAFPVGALPLGRRRWRVVGAAASVLVSLVLGIGAALGVDPAGSVSAFAGSRELTSFASLLAAVGAVTARDVGVGRAAQG